MEPRASVYPSANSLCISLENFRLDKAASNQEGSSANKDSPCSSSTDRDSWVETQTSEVANDPKESEFWTAAPQIPIRAARGEFLTPSNYQFDHNFSNRGGFLGWNHSGPGSYMAPSADSMSNNPNMYYQTSLINHLSEETGTGTNSFNLCNKTRRDEETLDTVSNKKSGLALLAMSQKGSIFLQNSLMNGDTNITKKILEGVIGSILELMTDEYGHHLFQRLIDSCNDHQMTRILLALISQKELLIQASFTQHGSSSIRQLLKRLKKSPLLLPTLTTALAFGFYTMMTHRTGQYVFQQCLIIQNNQQNEMLYEVVIKHCIQLATHEVGCLNLNKCIDCIKGSQRDRLLNLISEHSVLLSQDPSGNYVLQHILNLQNPAINDNICTRLKGHYVRLCLQKSGSFVVETCLTSPSHVAASCVVKELVASNKLLQIAKDQFGNYVIQTALKTTKCSDGVLHHRLVQALIPHLPQLKFHRNGKNVCNLIDGGVSVQEKKYNSRSNQF